MAFQRPYLFLRLAEQRRLNQGEQRDLLAGHCAYVVMQADNFDAGDPLHHCLQGRPRDLNQMTSHLLEKVTPLLGWQALNQMLLGRGQNAFHPHDDHFVDQVRMNVFLGTRPMYSCSNRPMPSETSLSISPWVFMRWDIISGVKPLRLDFERSHFGLQVG